MNFYIKILNIYKNNQILNHFLNFSPLQQNLKSYLNIILLIVNYYNFMILSILIFISLINHQYLINQYFLLLIIFHIINYILNIFNIIYYYHINLLIKYSIFNIKSLILIIFIHIYNLMINFKFSLNYQNHFSYSLNVIMLNQKFHF